MTSENEEYSRAHESYGLYSISYFILKVKLTMFVILLKVKSEPYYGKYPLFVGLEQHEGEKMMTQFG